MSMPRHTLYQLAARLDAVDAHAHITTGAHAGSFGANDLPIPTTKQAEAADYELGHTTVQGIAFAVEQPQGSFRKGVDEGGTPWECRVAAHYGYFTGTVGADGDGVDGFIGPFPEADTAYVINQCNKDGGFDEHKVMCGFKDARHAREAYLSSYERGWTGLGAVVPLSISQLRWWLEKGNTKAALTPDQLPQDGRKTTMTKTIAWNYTQPEGRTFDQVLYEARRMDGADGLLFDSLSMAEIMEDADSVHLLDALVVEYAQMGRIVERLRLVMDRSGGAVKAPAVQLSEPFKARGVTNVAAVYELSDGQTVSIFFHNPDTTPNKLATGDELVSWKWLLNKKDITIVVAPEKGQDLNPRTVAQRIMKLAEKNSAAFQKANVKRAERLGAIQSLRESITQKEAVLKDLGASIEAAKFEKVQRDGAAEGKVTKMGRDFYANKLTEADASDEWIKALDSTAGDTFKAALEIYRSKLQGTFVNTVAGKVLFTGKGGSEVRGWSRQRPLLAETVPFIPAILRSATTYKDEDLDKDRNGDFDFFRRFSGTQKLPSGFTVEAVVKVGVRADGEMFYHLRAEQVAMDDAKESAPDSNETAGADQKVGSPDLLDGYSTCLPLDSIGEYEDGVNLEIISVWDADGNKVSDFDAQTPIALVDAAYQFANATDSFKECVADSVEKTDYSPFASAKAMDQKAKELGAEIHWGMGPMLDSVAESDEDEDFDADAEFDACPVVDADDGEALDGDFKGHPFRGNQHKKASSHSHAAVRASISAKHAEKDGDAKGAKTAHKSAHYSHMAAAESTSGKARRYHRKMAKFHGSRSGMTLDSVALDATGDFADYIVGKIMKGGQLVGRAVIATGDGKAMVFVGESDDQRVHWTNPANGEVLKALWSDDDAADMVEWLLVPSVAPVAEPAPTAKPKPVAYAGLAYEPSTLTEADSAQAWNAALEGNAGDMAAAAKEVYRTRLQGTYVETNKGDVLISGNGWREMKEKLEADILRCKTIPYIPQILRTIEGIDDPLTKPRSDYSGFIKFEGVVVVADGSKIKAMLKVGIKKDGQLMYFLRASDSTLHDANKEGGELPQVKSPLFTPPGEVDFSTTLDEIVNSDKEDVNLVILAAWDKDGNALDPKTGLPLFVTAPIDVYAFKDASAEALGLLKLGAQNSAAHSTYKTAVSVEKAADAKGMTVRWDAVGSLPTFDDATGGLFGDGDSGFIRGALSYLEKPAAIIHLREDGMVHFAIDLSVYEVAGNQDADALQEDDGKWTVECSGIISLLSEVMTGAYAKSAADTLIDALKAAGFIQSDEWEYAGSGDMSDVAIQITPTNDAEASLMYWADSNPRVDGNNKYWKFAINIGELNGQIRADQRFKSDFSADEMQPVITELLADAKVLQAWVESGREKVKQGRAKQKDKTPAAPQPEVPPVTVPVENELTRLNAALKAAPKDRETVSSDDPQAIEKLERKLYALQLRQEFMKKTNKLIKKGDNAGLVAMGFNQATIESFKKPDFAGRIGYPDYELTNNNGVISNTRKRLEELQRRALEAAATKEPKVPTVTVPTQPTESHDKAQDRAFFMSLIDGTHPNLDDPALVDNLQAAYERNSEDAEMVSLFTQAINAFTTASLAETEGM